MNEHDDKVRAEEKSVDDETCSDRAQNAIAHHLSCAHRDIRLAMGAVLHILNDHPDSLGTEELRGANQLLGMVRVLEAGMDAMVAQNQRAQMIELNPSDLMSAIFGGDIHHDG
jgi:hypothetical protein